MCLSTVSHAAKQSNISGLDQESFGNLRNVSGISQESSGISWEPVVSAQICFLRPSFAYFLHVDDATGDLNDPSRPRPPPLEQSHCNSNPCNSCAHTRSRCRRSSASLAQPTLCKGRHGRNCGPFALQQRSDRSSSSTTAWTTGVHAAVAAISTGIHSPGCSR